MNDRFLLVDILKTKEIRDSYMKHNNLTEEKLNEIRNKKRKKIILDFTEKRDNEKV